MDKNQFCYVVVQIKGMNTAYSYINDDPTIKVGSYVLVPFGKANDEVPGIVLERRICTEEDAPFPVGKTKHIIRQLSPEEYSGEEDDDPEPGNFDDDDVQEMADYLENTEKYDYDYLFQWAYEHHEAIDSPETIVLVIRCYQLCAEQNMPLACLNLGTFYYNGTYLERDFKKAAALYKIAADSGVPVGIRNMGYCYYYGRHQPVDYAKAYEYFCKGALLFDDANCLYKLGDMYRSGLAVEKNEKYAFILFRRAMASVDADKDYDFCRADVLLRLGECELKGIGTSVDVENAHLLLQCSLAGFYERRKTDPFVSGMIKKVKALIQEAEAQLDEEII